jgi:uncharacterized protein with ATP-grasp and redox domains
MKIYHECIPCHVRAAVNSVRLLTDDEKTINRVIQKSLMKASEFESYKSLLELYYDIQKIVKKNSPERDPYKDFKKAFNKICLSLEDEMKDIINTSENPFETGLRICLAGNSIDVMQGYNVVDRVVLRKAIDNALVQPLDTDLIKEFEEEVKNADEILFVGDNAGEIVFDKVFIELLNKRYKKENRISYSVRGGYTLNDSTIEDAEMVGMDRVAKVITTGVDMPAAHLPLCSKEFINVYKNAGLVIAKGQGNLEALLGEDQNIFFLLKIKCNTIAKILNNRNAVNDIVIVRNKKGYVF